MQLTSSSSRSMAESAFIMIEPLSDSIEEDIFPAPRRSVGLIEKERKKKRGSAKEKEGGLEVNL